MGVWQNWNRFGEVWDNLGPSRPQISAVDILTVLQSASLLIIVGIICIVIYQRYFHPLAKFPGPFWSSVTTFDRHRRVLSGDMYQVIQVMHERYGPVVRIRPNELSFADADAIRDIYGFSKAHPGFEKDPVMYVPPPDGSHNVVIAHDNATHARMRKPLAAAFSSRAVIEQAPIINKYIDNFIHQISAMVKNNNRDKNGENGIDIFKWLNFVTFDIVTDLAFGESFETVKTGTPNDWFEMIIKAVEADNTIRLLRDIPGALHLVELFLPRSLKQAREQHTKFANEMTERRLNSTKTRKDFVDYILKANVEGRAKLMETHEIGSNLAMLVVAGSDSAGSLLCAAVYYLLRYPDKLAKLRAEILANFKSEDEITGASTKDLKYLGAVLEESLRIYPPAGNSQLSRVVSPGGAVIAGVYVPAGTKVATNQWVIHRSPKYFHDPNEFIPERWIEGSEHFGKDDLYASHPFTAGARGCLGKNLAFFESRIIMAKLAFLYEKWTILTPGIDLVNNGRGSAFWIKPTIRMSFE